MSVSHLKRTKKGEEFSVKQLKNDDNRKAVIHGPQLLTLIKDECLFEVFENTVRTFPENKAIIFGDSNITYNELNKLANRIAAMLRGNGIKEGDRIAILMPKCIECYAAIMGTMKSGACYIPLDVSYPEDRVKFIVENSSAKYILILEGSAYGDLFKNTITISPRKIKHYPSENILREESGVKNDSLAYIIYTSGSTGRPKGVMIEHRSACHLIRASQEIYRVNSNDRVYQGFTLKG
jgi:non-ribosomal peptide synthetase component F